MMPYVKFISGHAESCKWIRQYLERGGRALGDDYVNAAREGIDGTLWDSVMDATREEYGTQHARRGQRARRYEHIIISLDPSDEVTLDEFRDFITGIASEWFDDAIGRFQVAIVYHDDNSERISRGEEGVLHAHLVVNNVDLDSGLRISPKLTPKVVNDFATDVNMRALERGWHGFSKEGVSMTFDEMKRSGTSPSRGRYAARQLAKGIAAPPVKGENEYVFADRAGAAAAGREADAREETDHIDNSGDDAEVFFKRSGNKPGAPAGEAAPAGGDVRVRMTFAKGGEHTFTMTNQSSREDLPERRHREREGFSWKQDIRDRVDIAMRLSQSSREFGEICGLLGLGVSYNKEGEIKFSHPSAPDSRVVRGCTLGRDYSSNAIAMALALKDVARRQRAHDLPSRERYMRGPERSAMAREAARAEVDSARGSGDMTAIKELIAYNDSHGIKSYDDYPDDLQGRAVRAYAQMIGAFDAPSRHDETITGSLMDRLELQRFLREETGAGGLERGQDSARPDSRSAIDEGGDAPTHRKIR